MMGHGRVMPRNREEIARLRAEARQRHRAATRKVSRLKNNVGVNVAGTEYDPRRDLSKVKSYTAKQLSAYIAELNGFVSRSRQYVPDVAARPIPKTVFGEYKAVERAYNAMVNASTDDVKDIRLPSGMTIGERRAMLRANHPFAGNPSVRRPNQPVVRDSSEITSIDAMKKLVDNMRKQMTPKFRREELKRSREELSKIMDVINQPEVNKDINSLSARQFAILWNDSAFAEAASLQYELIMQRMTGKEQAWHSDVIETKFKEAVELVKWAKNI